MKIVVSGPAACDKSHIISQVIMPALKAAGYQTVWLAPDSTPAGTEAIEKQGFIVIKEKRRG